MSENICSTLFIRTLGRLVGGLVGTGWVGGGLIKRIFFEVQTSENL